MELKDFYGNPYLEAARPFLPKKRKIPADVSTYTIKSTNIYKHAKWQTVCMLVRPALIDRFSYAIPNEKALKAIAKYSPLIEIGAGKGYWAHMLNLRGADIICYDNFHHHFHCSRCRQFENYWYSVQRGGATAVKQHPDRTLFLCWPPLDGTMDSTAMKYYKGKYLLYVGEWQGCTGSEDFHNELDTKWNLLKTVRIPNWYGLHDALYIFRRKNERKSSRALRHN